MSEEQAAHKAAIAVARRYTTDHAQCIVYHAEMMKHERPTIEAAALRRAAGVAEREEQNAEIALNINLNTRAESNARGWLTTARVIKQRILALIPDPARNDGGV